MSDVIWKRRECVSAELEGSLVLLDLDTLVYHSLNGTASAVWELLAEPRDEAQLVGALCERYKVAPEVCRESVQKLIARMAESSLVTSVEQDHISA